MRNGRHTHNHGELVRHQRNGLRVAMGSGVSKAKAANRYKENSPPTVVPNDHSNAPTPNPDAPKRRTSLIPNTPHDVKVHSMISPSFIVDPSIAAAVPLAHATDEELLAEVARRKLNIRHNITDKVVKETYDIGEQIGKGASGVVLKVLNRQTRENFAMKVVEKNESMNDLDSMMTEIEIMKRVRHRHIVCMYELYEVSLPCPFFLLTFPVSCLPLDRPRDGDWRLTAFLFDVSWRRVQRSDGWSSHQTDARRRALPPFSGNHSQRPQGGEYFVAESRHAARGQDR
jgi:hypothetical protein